MPPGWRKCLDGSERAPRRIVQMLAGDGRGGADQVALSLGEGLRRRGHEVVFAVSADFLRHQDVKAFPVWEIERFRGLSLRAVRDVVRRARRSDLILTHDSGARHFALLAKLLGLAPPLWFFRHCISGTSAWGGTQLHRLLVREQIAVSRAVAQSLRRGGFPAARVHCLQAGRDLSAFEQPDPEAVARQRRILLGDADTGKERLWTIGMVARFSWFPAWRPDYPDAKGYDVLFRALARCDVPFRVLICGPEGVRDQEALRRMATHYGLDAGRLVFAGFQTDLAPLYPLMDLLVLPSRQEGLGLALVEAMAAGTPVLASRSGGIVEVVEEGHNGLLFPEGDAAALAQALLRLIREPALRHHLAAGGRRSSRENFTLSAMLDGFETLMAARLPLRAGAAPGLPRP